MRREILYSKAYDSIMAMNVILQKKKTLTESACLLKQGYIRLSYIQAFKETSLDFLHNHIAFAHSFKPATLEAFTT